MDALVMYHTSVDSPVNKVSAIQLEINAGQPCEWQLLNPLHVAVYLFIYRVILYYCRGFHNL
jgi:hypothetical protein